MPALAAHFDVGLAQLLRRGEGDRVDEKIEPAVDVADLAEHAGDVGVLLHVAGQDDFRAVRPDELADAALARRAGQVGKRQFGPFGVERLADGPSDAAIVGHAHYQADLAGEHAHAEL